MHESAWPFCVHEILGIKTYVSLGTLVGLKNQIPTCSGFTLKADNEGLFWSI
jgi:hypothetical protein